MSSMDQIISEMNIETSSRYAKCLETSNRNNWNIETSLIDGNRFDRIENNITLLLQQGPF